MRLQDTIPQFQCLISHTATKFRYKEALSLFWVAHLLSGSGDKSRCQQLDVESFVCPEGSRKLSFPDFKDNQHIKIMRLWALNTGRLYPQEIFLVLIFLRGWVNPRVIVRPEEKNEKPQLHHRESNPRLIWLVAQCLKQLRHRVLPCYEKAI